ncbi:hypothetical protein JCM10207_005315 [Rhodosporidiobolus poonsookiae]
MVKSFHKAVYKPDSQSTDEYIVVVGDVDAANKWIGGDRTIPLVEIVDSFDVFHTGQGSQGIFQRPSKQDLDNIFNSHNENDVVETILSKGRIISSDTPHQFADRNSAKSGSYQVSNGANFGGR